MSLDVYLTGETTEEPCFCPACDHSHTRPVTEQFFSANITHNLNRMAEAAGLYEPLWRPEEIGITKAQQLIPILQEGLERLRADREKYEAFNSPNGWGLYKNFVPWLSEYLAACEAWPDADVSVSR